MLLKHVFLPVLTLLIVACSPSPSAPDSSTKPSSETAPNSRVTAIAADDLEAAIINRDWILDQYEGDDGIAHSVTNEDDFEFTIRFTYGRERDGSTTRKAGGKLLCNFYGAWFSLQQNILSLDTVGTTEASCERVGEPVEAIFIRVLITNKNTTMLSVDGNRLEIASGRNEKLYFIDK